MPLLRVRRIEDGSLILEKTHHAKRFLQRLLGLLGRVGLSPDEGMLFEPGGSIHTFGMKFPIDVLFLDKDGAILGKNKDVLPNRFCIAPSKTRFVLEMASNTIQAHDLEIGHILKWCEDDQI